MLDHKEVRSIYMGIPKICEKGKGKGKGRKKERKKGQGDRIDLGVLHSSLNPT